MPQNIIATPQPGGKADVCTQGRSCGLACIDRDKECLKNLSPRSRALALAIAALIKDQSGVKTDAKGRTVSKDSRREKGLKKLLQEMKTANQNKEKAQKHAEDVCKTSGADSRACKTAKLAASKARDNRNDVNRHALSVFRALNAMTEADSLSRVRADKLRHTEEEVKRGKIEAKASQFVQTETQKAINAYHEKVGEAQKITDLVKRKQAEDKAFTDYKVAIDELYVKKDAKFPESIRVNPNLYYVSQELAEAAYDIMPSKIRNALNKAGSLPAGTEGVVEFKHGKNDFDENGLYTGGRGEVTGQVRDQKWEGPSRGVVSAEIYLRNEGRSGISMAENDLRTFQLEHLNDLSNNRKTAETYGNLFPAGGKENAIKGNQQISDYVDKILKGKNVDEVNAQAEAGSKKKKAELAIAKTWVNAPDVPSREAAMKTAVLNDSDAVKKFVASVKKVADFNKNNDNFNPDIKKFNKNSTTEEILEAYNNAPTGSEFHFIAAHAQTKTNNGSRRTYEAAGMASYGQDKDSGFRGSRTTKVKEGRVIAAAYAVGNDANRQELYDRNKEQMERVNKNKVKEAKMTGSLYNDPMKEFMNGDNDSGTDFSWFPR